MRSLKVLLTVVALLGFAGSAHATVIFSDNFDGEPGGSQLNYNSFANWDVSDGTVDLISSGGFSINCVGGSGKCVDLDGSTGNAGILGTKTTFNLVPGDYALSFAISGNQRTGSDDTVMVSLGSAFGDSYTKNGGDPFETVIENFTLTSTINANLAFEDLGNDNVGIVLDNVMLERRDSAAVPEPAALGIFGSGLLALAFLGRRRRTQ